LQSEHKITKKNARFRADLLFIMYANNIRKRVFVFCKQKFDVF